MREGRYASTCPWLGLPLLVALLSACGATVPSPSQNAATTQGAPTEAASSSPSTAPSPSATASQSAAASPAASDLETDLITAGRLTYCANLRPGRMGFLDANGKPSGVNIEIAREIAERLDLEAEIRETAFEDLIDAVAGGLCDMSISSQHITQTRLERIDMVPYTQGVQHVVVRVGNPAGMGWRRASRVSPG